MRAPRKEEDLKANAGKTKWGTHKNTTNVTFPLVEEEMVHVVL